MFRRHLRIIKRYPGTVLDFLILLTVLVTLIVIYQGLRTTRLDAMNRRAELSARIALLEKQMSTAMRVVSDPRKLAVLYDAAASLEQFKKRQIDEGIPNPRIYFSQDGTEGLIVYGDLFPQSSEDEANDHSQ